VTATQWITSRRELCGRNRCSGVSRSPSVRYGFFNEFTGGSIHYTTPEAIFCCAHCARKDTNADVNDRYPVPAGG
jgi:hypothetical protein